MKKIAAKGVAKEYDPDEYEKARAKRLLRKREPNTKMFKLRDPVSGLFWSSTMRPEFNGQGRKWGSEKAARRNWADYVHAGLLEGDDRPELELVEYHVEVTEKKAKTEGKPDMLASAAFEAMHMRNSQNTFVKETVRLGFKIRYLIECQGDTLAENTELHAKLRTMNIRFDARSFSNTWGSSRDDDLHVAVHSDEDIIFLKMLLSDYIVAIHDFNEIIAQYHEMIAAKRTLKKRAYAASFEPEEESA